MPIPGGYGQRIGKQAVANQFESEFARREHEQHVHINAHVPLKTVFYQDLTPDEFAKWYDITGKGVAETAGWGLAVCNGNNGTRNLIGQYIRGGIVAGVPVGSDSSAHDHDAGTLVAKINLSTATGKILQLQIANNFTADKEVAIAGIGASVQASTSGTVVDGDTGVASVTDNRPASIELIPVMRIF